MTEGATSFLDLVAVSRPSSPDTEPSQTCTPDLARLLAAAGLWAPGASLGDTEPSSEHGNDGPGPTVEDDAFAARLTAAFRSGAIDPRTRGAPALSAGPAAVVPVRRGSPPPTPGHRVTAPEGQRHKYVSTSLPGRSLYSPWP